MFHTLRFATKKAFQALIITMRRIYLVLVPLLIFSCKNGCNKTGKTETEGSDTTQTSTGPGGIKNINDPMTADSIVPPSLKDTAKFTELYDKDSLRMAIAFQLAANEMCKVLKQKNAEGFVKFTPPAVIKVFGGEEKFVANLKKGFAEESGTIDRIVAGPVKRAAASTDDQGYSHGWYCLIPVRRFVQQGGEVVMELQWFGGQTLDEGKKIHFMNVTKVPRDKIINLMPDLALVLDQEASNVPVD